MNTKLQQKKISTVTQHGTTLPVRSFTLSVVSGQKGQTLFKKFPHLHSHSTFRVLWTVILFLRNSVIWTPVMSERMVEILPHSVYIAQRDVTAKCCPNKREWVFDFLWIIFKVTEFWSQIKLAILKVYTEYINDTTQGTLLKPMLRAQHFMESS